MSLDAIKKFIGMKDSADKSLDRNRYMDAYMLSLSKSLKSNKVYAIPKGKLEGFFQAIIGVYAKGSSRPAVGFTFMEMLKIVETVEIMQGTTMNEEKLSNIITDCIDDMVENLRYQIKISESNISLKCTISTVRVGETSYNVTFNGINNHGVYTVDCSDFDSVYNFFAGLFASVVTYVPLIEGYYEYRIYMDTFTRVCRLCKMLKKDIVSFRSTEGNESEQQYAVIKLYKNMVKAGDIRLRK